MLEDERDHNANLVVQNQRDTQQFNSFTDFGIMYIMCNTIRNSDSSIREVNTPCTNSGAHEPQKQSRSVQLCRTTFL